MKKRTKIKIKEGYPETKSVNELMNNSDYEFVIDFERDNWFPCGVEYVVKHKSTNNFFKTVIRPNDESKSSIWQPVKKIEKVVIKFVED